MTTILSIALIILSLLLIVGAVVIRNLLKQNDELVEIIQIYSNKVDSVEEEAIKYQRYYLELITQTYQELQRIDKRGSFSSDDEVGFSFRILFTAIENLKLKLGSIEIEEENGSEKS